MSRTERHDVLVVGAGPVGLALGCGLRRYDLDVLVVDALPQPTSQSRATDLQPRSLEVLDAMGVIDDFLEVARRIERIRFFSKKDEIFRLDFEHLDTPYPFLLSQPQAVTEALLDRRLRALGAEVERPWTLTRFEDRGEHVAATLEGPGGVERRVEARWLVGCDGANSTVRRGLGLAFEGHTYGQSFVIADVEVEGALPRDEICLCMHPDGFLTLLALPGDGHYRLFFDASPSLQQAPSLGELQRMVDTRTALPFRLEHLRWISVFHIHQRMVERYRVGNVFVAGNAAHIHSPAGGQGMNTGIQDAHNLAWKLAAVRRGVLSEALLDTYHDERHPVARLVLLETDVATTSSMLRNPVARALRDAGARLASLLAPVSGRLEARCAELDLGYDEGLLVGEQSAPLLTAPLRPDRTTEAASLADRARFGEGPHAGDRAPDVGGLRLLHAGDLDEPGLPVALREMLRRPGFLLLLFDGEAATEAGYENLGRIRACAGGALGDMVWAVLVIHGQQAPAGWEGDVLLDPEGALHGRYGASSECLYLIRPDGHIGFRCQPADAGAFQEFLGRFSTSRGWSGWSG